MGLWMLGDFYRSKKGHIPPGDTLRPCHHCNSEWKDKLVPWLGSLLRCTSYTWRILQWRVTECTTIYSLPTYSLFPLSWPEQGSVHIFSTWFLRIAYLWCGNSNYFLPINYCFCKANNNSKHKKFQQSWKSLTLFSLNIHNIEYFKLKVQS